MTIISSGSTPVEPVSVNVLEVNSANRYDVLIDTHKMPAMLYKITIETNYRGNDIGASGIFSNVYLRYQGARNTISPLKPANTSQPWYHQIGLLKTRSDSVESVTAPNVEVIFDMSQQYTNASTLKGLSYTASNTNGYLRWTVNQQSFEFPSTPLLLASYYGKLNSANYGPASLPIPIKYNDMVQIVIQNRAGLNGVCEQHPWHLHGHSFWILATGPGEYDPVKSPQLFNLVNPLKADMVTSFPTNMSNWRQPHIPPFKSANAHKPCGWAVIRFKANNPGLWAFHCHIEYHVVIGMATVFNVASTKLWEDKKRLPEDYGTCGFISSETPKARVPSKKPLYKYPSTKPVKKPSSNHNQGVENAGTGITSSQSSASLSPGVYAGIAIGGFVLIALAIFSYYYMKKFYADKTKVADVSLATA